jgi:hypothetical protein
MVSGELRQRRYFAVIAFTDPFAPRIGWAFYNSVGSTNFDRVIFYDWQLDRWSYAEVTAQYWASLVTAGVTLEDLDVYGDIDSGGIPYPFDSRVWEGGAPVIGASTASGKMAFLRARRSPARSRPARRTSIPARSKDFVIEPMGVFNDATPTLRIGKRENTQHPQRYTSAASPSTLSGLFRVTASGACMSSN